ncbi:MFS transporter [Subtercola sp. RTI3]|uniref:MFS transporter n=1 Tax=Subtercola sp. RTI3 TaxID=3048639 RepID=UPI002B230B6D|nr:MFS transporter [Subtercola sp. RTI3]MEA9986958.1 MFS transporter [Subtercola sp. RTI3]
MSTPTVSRAQRLVLFIAILASFVSFLDSSVINVALPAIARELGGGLTTQQWAVDAYLITLGSLILLAGSLSDVLGRIVILRIGLVGFGVTSLLCAFAPTPEVLIVGRALQGVAGALLVPSSLALITSSYSGVARAKAIGQWTAGTTVSFLAGPLLGGVLVDTVGWRWVFGVNVLPIAVTLVLLFVLKQKDVRKAGVRIDFIGAALCVLGLGGPVYALIERSNYGWGSPVIFVPLGVGILCFAGFIWRQKTAKQPLMPLGLFAVRNFAVGNIATAFIYAALSIGGFIIVLFLQQVAGLPATLAALALLPVSVLSIALSSLFGSLAGRFGPRLFMGLGPIVAGVGYLLMLSSQANVDYWSQLLPGVILFGIGMTATVAPLTATILGSISEQQSGIGSAINNAVSRVAGLVAIALIGVIVGDVLDVNGFHRALAVTAGLLIVGGIVSAIGIQNARKPAVSASASERGAEV